MFNPVNIIALFALLIIFTTLIRTRRRIKKMENLPKGTAADIKAKAESQHRENRMIEMANFEREFGARVQNWAMMLEKQIEDAKIATEKLENKILEYQGLTGKKVGTKTGIEDNHPIVRRVIELSNEGKDNEDISQIMNRLPGEIELMKRLGRQAQQSSQ